MPNDKENMSDNATKELLIRIDERTKNFGATIDEIKGKMVTQKEFEAFAGEVRGDMTKMVTQEEFKPFKDAVLKVGEIFVTKVEFKPVRSVAYGVISLLCGGVFLILISAIVAAASK